MSETCKGCSVSVLITESEVQRIVDEYFAGKEMASAEVSTQRLALCRQCPDLHYGTTCAHCGCLVQVIARVKEKTCPAAIAKW